MSKRYMTFAELGSYIGVATKTLRNWKSSAPHKLPPHVAVSVGGTYDSWRFDSEAVDKWLLDNARQAKRL